MLSCRRSEQQDYPEASEATTRSGTKQARAIEMLRSPDGASIAALMEAAGRQQHSVRELLARLVRKGLGLPLQSTKVDGGRVYRITETRGSKPWPGGAQQELRRRCSS